MNYSLNHAQGLWLLWDDNDNSYGPSDPLNSETGNPSATTYLLDNLNYFNPTEVDKFILQDRNQWGIIVDALKRKGYDANPDHLIKSQSDDTFTCWLCQKSIRDALIIKKKSPPASCHISCLFVNVRDDKNHARTLPSSPARPERQGREEVDQ